MISFIFSTLLSAYSAYDFSCPDLVSDMMHVKTLGAATARLEEGKVLVTASHLDFAIQVILMRTFGLKKEVPASIEERREFLDFITRIQR